MKEKKYDRQKAKAYAMKWAYLRNPSYYNYDEIGGDCTNFISQCLYAGCGIMNYSQYGWYYRNANDKSPSWTGVEFLFQFLLQNKGVGPYAQEVEKEKLEVGDVVQLSFDGIHFNHSLLVVNEKLELIATHTFDSYGKKISSYSYQKRRNLHIKGVRIW